MTHPDIFSGTLTRERFLRDYWQRRPLLIRNAIDPALLQFPPEELAGMACEEGIESRLIRQLDDDRWELQHGPLDEAVFATLPEARWTLLVQDVDKYVPEVGDLLDLFDFLPDWRIDDIMISYATDQGGVGPHTDSYDVFLVQAFGKRRWRLSERTYHDDDLLPDCPLRVLSSFDTSDDWVLEPGDLLYLPPRLAHWGTAEGECMTWSVGMRDPAGSELAQSWLAHLAECSSPAYFADDLPNKAIPAEISATEIANALELIADTQPRDDAAFRRWFGAHVTEPKHEFEIEAPDPAISVEHMAQRLANGERLRRHPWARFAKLHIDQESIALCSQGLCHELPAAQEALVDLVCGARQLDPAALGASEDTDALLAWLARLYNHGLLIFDE